MQVSELRRPDGTYPAFAWPGGYPLIYLDANGDILCPACTSREDEYNAPTVSGEVYWEGPDLCCFDCNAIIESAYGDPNSAKCSN